MPRLAIHCALSTILVFLATPAQAEWCASYRHGGSNCYFTSHAQCQAAVSGVGGFCTPTGVEERARSRPTKPPTSRREHTENTKKKEKFRSVERRKSKAQPAAHPPSAASAPAKAAAPAATAGRGMPGNFAAARQLVLDGQFQAGIEAMHALGFDDHPDIATYIGLAHSKLGRTDQARSWYDRALAADPNHLLTLSFYGMLHANRGDLRRAQDELEKLRRLCNANCNEYRALEAVLATKPR